MYKFEHSVTPKNFYQTFAKESAKYLWKEIFNDCLAGMHECIVFLVLEKSIDMTLSLQNVIF